eukprot:GFUD01028861.1.p1 GENE.GFUD01028861.1~~GFUD01028861.1.p1  ORF type:complete len:420 (-),score=137.67 GFUD01028861.1:132-1391(-)
MVSPDSKSPPGEDTSPVRQSPPPVSHHQSPLSYSDDEDTSVPPDQEQVPFLSFAASRYKARPGSIFLDGLVGGMFLSFLMDTEETCHDRFFVLMFFIIGMSHFICGIVENLDEYADQAAALDEDISLLETRIRWTTWLMLQVLRLTQFPLVVVLGYYSIKFSVLEPGRWTHNREKVVLIGEGAGNCSVCFCEGNYVHLAQITFAFQTFLGVVLVILWWVMWYVDREDDAGELKEQGEWQRNEVTMSITWWGKIREIVLLIGMQSFYNDSVAGTMLALSVSLPHESCNIHVMEWFLYAGIIYTLTGVLNQVREGVEEMAILDGIINKAEHRMITFLKFCNFPLFLAEFVCFIMIVNLVIANAGNITFDDANNEFYCEKGTWKLMMAVNGIYSIVFLFRVTVIIGALWTGCVKDDQIEAQA